MLFQLSDNERKLRKQMYFIAKTYNYWMSWTNYGICQQKADQLFAKAEDRGKLINL